ncbi:MAG: diaminopimelate decarboxylase [bacterium]
MTSNKIVDFLTKTDHFPHTMIEAAETYGSPLYIYEEETIINNCQELLNMPSGYGLTVRYAMKANSNRSILNLIHKQGLLFDMSSMNEIRRAKHAGIHYDAMLLTSQDLPKDDDYQELKKMIQSGLQYTVCSINQMKKIIPIVLRNGRKVSIRIHPGKGSGVSATRNTGDPYASFGVLQSDLSTVRKLANDYGIKFYRVHVHIGSGSDPGVWKKNIDNTLQWVENFFPDCRIVNLGGGFRVARMPEEKNADITSLGNYAKKKFKYFHDKTGRKLHMEIEPGNYVIANAGYIITKVIDKKFNRKKNFYFIITNGGMESNIRPLMYGALHPIYVISKKGKLLSSEFKTITKGIKKEKCVVVGRCCETGDCQTLNSRGEVAPRLIAEPDLGDWIVIGGTGAYCSSMAPVNYNSYLQPGEVMITRDNKIQLIRRPQTIEQMICNEYNLSSQIQP